MPNRLKLLMVDNYDSFTYNLVQYFGELGAEVEVFRNDEITLEGIAARRPDRLVISPGPCSPAEAGISVAAIRHFAGQLPILGVCLGHQSIGAAFGGTIVRAQQLMHGKVPAWLKPVPLPAGSPFLLWRRIEPVSRAATALRP